MTAKKKRPAKKKSAVDQALYTIDLDGVERRNGVVTGRLFDVSTPAKVRALAARLRRSQRDVKVHRVPRGKSAPLVVTLPPITHGQLAAVLAPLGYRIVSTHATADGMQLLIEGRPWAGAAR